LGWIISVVARLSEVYENFAINLLSVIGVAYRVDHASGLYPRPKRKKSIAYIIAQVDLFGKHFPVKGGGGAPKCPAASQSEPHPDEAEAEEE